MNPQPELPLMDQTLIYPMEGITLPMHNGHPQKAGDVGINLPVRAVIRMETHEQQLQRNIPYMRSTICDFRYPPSKHALDIRTGDLVDRDCIQETSQGWSYRLKPMKTVALGLGVVVGVPQGYGWYVQPRGGTIQKAGRNCTLMCPNAAVPGDAGFTGELWGQLFNLGPDDFLIDKNSVLFQLVRIKLDVSLPWFVESYADIPQTERGACGNGHTDKK